MLAVGRSGPCSAPSPRLPSHHYPTAAESLPQKLPGLPRPPSERWPTRGPGTGGHGCTGPPGDPELARDHVSPAPHRRGVHRGPSGDPDATRPPEPPSHTQGDPRLPVGQPGLDPGGCVRYRARELGQAPEPGAGGPRMAAGSQDLEDTIYIIPTQGGGRPGVYLPPGLLDAPTPHPAPRLRICCVLAFHELKAPPCAKPQSASRPASSFLGQRGVGGQAGSTTTT